jgi:glycosyltransferase involved in cell wall biosynthesis
MTTSTRAGTAPPRIAILADSLARWTGGIDFLRLCVGALNSVSPETPWSILLPSRSIPKSLVVLGKNAIKALAGMKASPLPTISRGELIDTLASSGVRIDVIEYRDAASGLASAMRRCRAEALFPCANSLGRTFPLPWIGYIPDLQHKRLPHWFSERERRARDKVFSRILAEAPAVVVNSAAVVKDIEEFYPNRKGRIFALPFCPPVNLWRHSNPSGSEVRATYHLPARYFMVSNQFWIHKSHETVFMALRHVRDAGHDVRLVCTGNTFDYRWPEHFKNLEGIIEANDLRDYIHILGVIPKSDQLAIMRESLAVVQPTLFEGGPGGGSVYDAVSINKPSIVSDIPVNREIDIGVVRFFAAGSAEDLAGEMVNMLVTPPEMPSSEENLARLTMRQQELGSLLLDISHMLANPHARYTIEECATR